MATTTSRLALLQPVGADAVSEYRLSITGNAATLDDAAMYSEGALASRPVAGSTPAGWIYKGTDTGLYYLNTGSAWLTIMVAGPWTNVTRTSGWAAGLVTPACRSVGDEGRLRGQIENTTGGTITPPSQIATVTVAVPANNVLTIATCDPASGPLFPVFLEVSITGQLDLIGPSVSNNDTISLDGVTYSAAA